jgi:hypothetical protein
LYGDLGTGHHYNFTKSFVKILSQNIYLLLNMKQYFFFLGFILSVSLSFGQPSAELSSDSLAQILCRKWVISRMTMNGQPMNSEGLGTTYEFKPDNSVVRIWEKGTNKGVWNYDSINHVVHLILKKKDHLFAKFVNPEEFELLTDLNEDADNPLQIKVYFKPSNK